MLRRLRPGLFAIYFLFYVLSVQLTAAQNDRIKNVLQPPAAPRAQVLILGTFHFQDAGADDYKPKFKLDIFSPARQKEISEVLNSLAQYKPTRIAVEWAEEKQAELNIDYQKYLAGQFELEANEIYQLGFRLAKQLGHHQIYAIDARQRSYDPNVTTELLIQRAQKNSQMDLLKRGPEWLSYFDKLSEQEDKLKTQMTIPHFLAYLNTPEQLRLTLGRYLIGQIEVGGNGDYIGADLQTAWYNRNLRIFSNIQRIPLKNDERVLVIIGQGHVPILHHLFENIPEYQLIPVKKYIKVSKN